MIKITSLFLLLLMTSLATAQDAGDADLEAAFELKIKAEKVGDYEKVVKLCKSAIEKGLDDDGEEEAKSLAGAALIEQAEQLMIRLRGQQERDPTFFRNKAVKLLKEAVEFDPETGDAWLMLTKLNMIPGGDPGEASSNVDRAIGMLDEQAQKQSEAYFLRSILTQRDDQEASREDLDKSIELNESNFSALRRRSTIQILEGDVEGGLADSDAIIELNDGNLNVLIAQGESLTSLVIAKQAAVFRLENMNEDEDDDQDEDDDENAAPKQSKKELEADIKLIRESVLGIYTKATELAPEKEEYALKLVDAYRELDQNEEALKAIDAMIERDDKSVQALHMKAQILLADEENDDKTLEVLDLALDLDPYDTVTRRLRMQYFSARDQFSDAAEEAEKILEKEPNNSRVMDQLATLYSLDEKPEKAIEIYTGLLSQMPTSLTERLPLRTRPVFLAQKIGTLRSRGDAYLSTGEHENAIEDYEEALDIGDQIEEMQASLPNPTFDYTPDDGVLNNLAWVLSTSTDDELRDGKRAIELATLACEVTDYKMPHILSTLASAYAEAGNFEKAREWTQKGIKLNEERELSEFVTEEVKKSQLESLKKELAFYMEEKPWRENQAEEDAAKKKAEKAAKKDKSDDDDDSDEDDDKEDEDQ